MKNDILSEVVKNCVLESILHSRFPNIDTTIRNKLIETIKSVDWYVEINNANIFIIGIFRINNLEIRQDWEFAITAIQIK